VGVTRFRVAAVVVAAAVALVVLVVRFPTDGSDTGSIGLDPVEPHTGDVSVLVRESRCRDCHGMAPGEPEGVAPNLELLTQRLEQRLVASGSASAEAYVTASIANHCAYTVPGYDCRQVPEFGLWLGSDEVAALAAWVLQREE
jgi:hypothetical protein